MNTVARNIRTASADAISKQRLSSQTGLVRVMAGCGAGFIAWMVFLFARWMTSDQFRPVDPGIDPLPPLEAGMLLGLQVGGFLLTFYFLYAYVVKPKLAGRPLATEGLLILGLGFLWWTDPTFNYTQNWLVYNAHLWNMGSWAGPPFPGWVAVHSDQFPEPLVVGIGQIFWLFAGALFGSWLMRVARDRWSFGSLSIWVIGFVGCIAFDMFAEVASVFLGWYVMPGAVRSMSLFPGTRYQVSLIEIFFGSVQTIGIASLQFVRDDHGHTWADRGAEKLRVSEGTRTCVRFLAIVGALNLVSVAGYFVPIQLQGLHSDPWPSGLPSYFTMTCPDYKRNPAACGGPGVPIPRLDHRRSQDR